MQHVLWVRFFVKYMKSRIFLLYNVLIVFRICTDQQLMLHSGIDIGICYRYYNDRDLWGKIPPYHVAHCRMFCNLDGHKLPHGIKVVASSNYPMYMHKFNIKMMMYP